MFALMMWVGGPALAHLPHAQVQVLAVPHGEVSGLPWYLVVNPSTSLVYESYDEGLTWEMIATDATRDLLIGGAALSDGTLALVTEGGFWWRDVETDAWSFEAIEALTEDASVAADDTLYLEVGEEIWMGHPADGLVADSTIGIPLRDLRASDDGIVAADINGNVWIWTGSTWENVGDPNAAVAVVAGDEIYIGTEVGLVRRYDGDTWLDCSPLPAGPEDREWYPDVVEIAWDDPWLLVTPAWSAPFVSDDGCESWRDDRLAEIDAAYEGAGGTEGPEYAYTSIYASGERWLVGGWDGLAVTADAGVNWQEPMLLPPDYTRGLEFSPSYAEDGILFVGAYAAGPIRSEDWGRTFDAPGLNLQQPNVQKVHVPAYAEDPSTVFGIVNHTLWRSKNTGESWSWIELPFASVNDVRSFVEPERVWAISAQTGPEGGTVAESADGGDTWAELPALTEAAGASKIAQAHQAALADGTYRVCGVGTNPMTVICEDGEDGWETLFEGNSGQSTAYSIVAWPPEAAESLLVTGLGELWRSPDLGESWEQVDLGEQEAQYVEIADDGSLFLSTASARIYRSLDGGEGWEDIGIQLPGSVQILLPHPDFGEVPELWIGGHGGLYVVHEASGDDPTLARWGGYQRIDDASAYMENEDCEQIEDEAASIQQKTRLTSGCSVYLQIRGDRLHLLGEIESESSAAVWIDGVEAATFGEDVGASGSILTIEGLEDSWHEISIVGLSGDGILLDAVESYGAGDDFWDGGVVDTGGDDTGGDDTSGDTDGAGEDPERPPATEPNCSCGSAGGGGIAWLLALGLAARRRGEG